ncbi:MULTISPECIES: 3'-5' exonuclease [unclassified Anaerobiospirillum]|uniref:3'-5' exonuclease n=1 Tax=unclassified Anaerobiospirillum TaxID=2647410 RepID=UPI001FF3EADD|nr:MULTISPECIES: 3'-5' exonuclease [unclassified Anaerobiospirillum]MCK0534820.1 3'-5' exonuclease [Anaerobiospirillum sp. NML120511]MCK0539866.1 3'-5' exonuclease [Anaerobiospirillum sp. NML02-A-032]
MDSFPLNRIEDIKCHPNDFRLLERVPVTRADVQEMLPIILNDKLEGENTWSVVFLDTETTGMNAVSDKVIELGMVRCTFSLDRKILLSIDRIFDAYEDPKRPIPPEITRLTGISDDMVKGQRFDDETVLNYFVDGPLVVAHNASFDRPFVDRRFSNLERMPWACTQKEIDWSKLGFGGYKLEFLLQSSGYFYEAHRACNDCLALCYLMYITPGAFEFLYNSSIEATYKIEAIGAPFDCKDNLKSHGYRWDSNEKFWYIQVTGATAVTEQLSFLQGLYRQARDKVRIIEFTARERYRA